MCNFGDCAVGNNHLKAFYEQVGWHRRFQYVFQLRVWTIERLHSVFVSVTCQWNSNMYSFNTAPQYWLSTCALTHTHTHTQWFNELLIPLSSSKLPLFKYKYCSLLYSSLRIPRDPQKNFYQVFNSARCTLTVYFQVIILVKKQLLCQTGFYLLSFL